MRIRRLPMLLLAALTTLTQPACDGGVDGGTSSAQPRPASNPSFAAGSTMQQLAQADRIRVGTKFDQPLFGLRFLDGKPQGFDVEVARLIATELGIPAQNIEWVETVSANR